MYLKRKIDQYLQEWKAGENRKPLIVKGARQIGKTESIREFAKANYSSFTTVMQIRGNRVRLSTA